MSYRYIIPMVRMDVLRLLQIILLTTYTSTGFFIGLFSFLPPITGKEEKKRIYAIACIINCISTLWLSFTYMNWIFSGWNLVFHYIWVIASSVYVYYYFREKEKINKCYKCEKVEVTPIAEPIEIKVDNKKPLIDEKQNNNVKEEFQMLMEEGYSIGVLDENFIKKYKES